MSFSNLSKSLSKVTPGTNPVNLVKEMKKINRQAIKLLPKDDNVSSPYFKDSPNYNPKRLEDSTQENDWKYVASSQEEQIKINQEPEIKENNSQYNKRKLNII